MKLSELCQTHSDIRLINDSDFNMLGMVTTIYHDEKVLSFIEAEKYLDGLLANPNISAVICTQAIVNSGKLPESMGVVVADKPRRVFYQVHNELADKNFYWEKFENRIHPTAKIHPTAVLYDHSIEIGEGCLIEANVVIHPGTILGKNCIIRSGSQIATCGFQFLNDGEEVISVTSGGRVIMEDYVEVQHLTCIDRGVFGGSTILKRFAKIDNQCQIAHDAYIGERTLIVSGTQFGGRVTIGDDGWCGINSTVSNGRKVGDKGRVSLGAVVTKDVPAGETVTGNFAIEHDKFLENLKKIR